MSGKKILYVINHLDWFWSHRLPLAQGAQKAGWAVSVTVPGAGHDPKLQQHGFKGLELPGSLLATIPAIYTLIKKERADLVHAITLKTAFITGLAALPFHNLRRVYTIAGLGYLFSGEGLKPKILRILLAPFFRLVFRSSNTQLIFQNPDDMQIFIARGFASQQQCHLIRGSGVDTAQFMPQKGGEGNPPIVLMPTRLVHDKGVAVFIEAARILKTSGSPARFQIAGGISTSNPNAISEAEIKSMTADGAAAWLGKVSDMVSAYASATLIAYPSYYREGIPKVLLEACAMGKAIVTTDHPGCREPVAHNDNGLLVPVKDAKALAQAIEILLNDPQRRRAMELRSRARAEVEFDVRLIVAQTLRIYGREA